MKEIKDTNKWKNIHAHGLEKLNMLKCPYYTKWSTNSVLFLSKSKWLLFFLEEKEKEILQFV